MKRPGNARLSFVERTGMPGLTILGALSQGWLGKQRVQKSLVPTKRPGAHKHLGGPLRTEPTSRGGHSIG